MCADAQRHGRPGEYRWRPLFNAAKFGWRPILISISLHLRHVSTIGKKPVKLQYLLRISSQYGELRPTNGWDPLHLSKFQRVLRLGFVTAATSITGDQQNCTMFGRLLGWYTYTFWALLPPGGILPAATFTLRASLAFYIGIVTARH